MSVRVIPNPAAGPEIRQRASVGLRRATQDLRKGVSRPRTPFKTGDLANRGLMQVLGLHGKASWDVVYAQYQERGARADGSHRIRRRPSGGQSHFAETSAKEVAKRGDRYFK
jgi:hypothetical protein